MTIELVRPQTAQQEEPVFSEEELGRLPPSKETIAGAMSLVALTLGRPANIYHRYRPIRRRWPVAPQRPWHPVFTGRGVTPEALLVFGQKLSQARLEDQAEICAEFYRLTHVDGRRFETWSLVYESVGKQLMTKLRQEAGDFDPDRLMSLAGLARILERLG